VESRFAQASKAGPCKACGAPVELPIPIRISSNDRAALCNWPRESVENLFCICGEPFSLQPFPVVYWGQDEIALILDGPRKAAIVLRMILSWIVDDERWHAYADKQVLVFGHMEDFTYKLQHPGAALFMQEVYSSLAPDDVFDETSAMIDFVDGALAMQTPGLD